MYYFGFCREANNQKILRNILKNTAKYCNLLQFTVSTAKYYKILQHILKILQNIAKYCKIVQNTTKYYKIPKEILQNILF
jgi:predicted metal-dependent HD superfamily phosphohydrolase